MKTSYTGMVGGEQWEPVPILLLDSYPVTDCDHVFCASAYAVPPITCVTGCDVLPSLAPSLTMFNYVKLSTPDPFLVAQEVKKVSAARIMSSMNQFFLSIVVKPKPSVKEEIPVHVDDSSKEVDVEDERESINTVDVVCVGLEYICSIIL